MADCCGSIEELLSKEGIDLKNLCCGEEGGMAKVICVAPKFGASVQEMSTMSRGETVMVRTDDETLQQLDAWIETGYFKSRSEAAALFMRDGLKIRSSELAKLKDALQEVEKARKNLQDKARDILGNGTD